MIGACFIGACFIGAYFIGAAHLSAPAPSVPACSMGACSLLRRRRFIGACSIGAYQDTPSATLRSISHAIGACSIGACSMLHRRLLHRRLLAPSMPAPSAPARSGRLLGRGACFGRGTCSMGTPARLGRLLGRSALLVGARRPSAPARLADGACSVSACLQLGRRGCSVGVCLVGACRRRCVLGRRVYVPPSARAQSIAMPLAKAPSTSLCPTGARVAQMRQRKCVLSPTLMPRTLRACLLLCP